MECPGPSWPRSARAALGAATAYAAALAAVHAPVLAAPWARVLGPQVAGLYVWEAWWFMGAWRRFGDTPLHSASLMHPAGVPAGPHSPLAAALYWPLAAALGPYAGLNAFALLAYLGAGLGMFLLAFDLTACFPAALAAGFVFMFGHEALTQHALGQFGQAFTGFVPVLLLGLRRAADGRPARAALWAGAAGSALATPYVAFAALCVGGPLYAAALLARGEVRRPREFAREALVAAAIAGALGAVLYWPVLAPLSGLIGGSEPYSLSLLSFLDFPSWHPSSAVQSLRAWTSGFTDRAAQGTRMLSHDGLAARATAEHLMGFFPLSLLGLLAWGARARALQGQGAWGWLAAGAAVLSLGPRLELAYEPTAVPLPYALIKALPVAGSLRAPARLIMLAWVCAAVLAAFALRELWRRLEGRPARRAAAAALLAGAFCWESALWKAGTWWGPVPSGGAYAFLAADPRPGAVLELPAAIGSQGDVSINVQLFMLAQPLHGRPLTLGRPPRHTWESLRACLETDALFELTHPATLAPLYSDPRLTARRDALRRGGRAALAGAGVGFVVLHARDPIFSDAVIADARRFLEDLLGAPALIDEAGTAVWSVAP